MFIVPYQIKDISDYILWYCHQKQYYVNMFKLQQILYFLQAEFLVAHKTPLFKEKIEAIDWGIKIKPIYDEYRIFGSALIPYIEDSDITLKYFELIISSKDIENIDDTSIQKILKEVNIKDVAIALKGADDNISSIILKNQSNLK